MRRSILSLATLCLVLSGAPVRAYEGSGLQGLQQFSDGLAELAARVKPGVVAIKTEFVLEYGQQNPFTGTPFEDFFRGHPFFREPEGGPQKQFREGLGSGVIVSKEGYILTNNHVVTAGDRETVANRISVEMEDKRTFQAKVVGRDAMTDLAVLKIEGDQLPVVSYGNSDALRVGELVVAVGNPFGQLHTVTSGIISAVGRSGIGLARYEDYIQTDAAINPGNSGGALVNVRGELVGINTAIVSHSGGYQGIGFAVPINMARDIMNKLIVHGEVQRGFLGIVPQDIDENVARTLGVKTYGGVLVGDVVAGKPADKAGLRRGDVIVDVEGDPMESAEQLRNAIAGYAPGTVVRLRVLRDGKERLIKVELEQLQAEELASRREPGKTEKLGMSVQDLTPQLERQLGYEGEKGVVITGVEPGSPAARAGLRRGDLIQEVDRARVESVADFRGALEKGAGKEAVLLLVRRGEYTQFVALRLPDGE